MKTKRFIKSSYYGLEEVHALNTFLKELPEATMSRQLSEEVYELTRTFEPFEKLDKYVPGSESYKKIEDQLNQYKEAQIKLKEINYRKDVILDECFPDYLTVTKHLITYKHLATEYDYNDELIEYEREVTEFFYTSGFYKSEIVYNPKKLMLPYTNKESNGGEDLIAKYIRNHNYTSKRLYTIEKCLNRGWDPQIFMKVFDWEEIDILTDISYSNIQVYDPHTNTKYWDSDIVKLMEDYKVAKTKRYIKNDEYVQFPYCSYTKFLTLLGTEYFEDTAKS